MNSSKFPISLTLYLYRYSNLFWHQLIQITKGPRSKHNYEMYGTNSSSSTEKRIQAEKRKKKKGFGVLDGTALMQEGLEVLQLQFLKSLSQKVPSIQRTSERGSHRPPLLTRQVVYGSSCVSSNSPFLTTVSYSFQQTHVLFAEHCSTGSSAQAMQRSSKV